MVLDTVSTPMVLESASMETPLERGECDKIGGKALDNGERNEQVVKAKWRRAARSSRERKENERKEEKL